MILFPYLIFAFSFSIPVLAQMTTSLAYDVIYGDANLPLSRLACSDGSNGLESKGYTTLGSFSNFPYLGGAPTVADWNDPNCGKCYAVTSSDGHFDRWSGKRAGKSGGHCR